jgi:hypothetical protein
VLLFQPTSQAATPAGDTVTVRSAVNELCPKATYDSLCARVWGWQGDHSVTTWNVLDRNNERFFATGTSADGATCADRGKATMTFFRDNVSGLELELFEGFADWAGLFSGWKEVKVCHTRDPIFGICLDYHYITKYTKNAYEVTLHSDNNAHFCGDIRTRGDRELDSPCKDVNACPKLRTF